MIDDVCRILIRHKKAGGSFFALIGSQAVRPLGNGAENRQIVFYVFLIPKCVFGQKQRQFRMQAGRRGEGFSVIREILSLDFLLQAVQEQFQRVAAVWGEAIRVEAAKFVIQFLRRQIRTGGRLAGIDRERRRIQMDSRLFGVSQRKVQA